MLNFKVSFSRIFVSTLVKMSPWRLISNPILLVVWCVAATATITLLILIINYDNENIVSYIYTTFWLWMTVFFSSFAEVLVETKWTSRKITSFVPQSDILVKKLFSFDNITKYIEIKRSQIRPGDLILLTSGDVVPCDGIIVKGTGYVNETHSTGELALVLKSDSPKDNIMIAESYLESSDWFVMQVNISEQKSFFSTLSKLLGNIERQAIPSEVALQRIISGLLILFMAVMFTVVIIAGYLGVNISVIYILDLIVILLPTTISGLQHAIILYGFGILSKKNIIIRDKMALDNAVDVNVVVIDKTGTITEGQREMIDFITIDKVNEEITNRALYLSSVHDDTTEGKSIKDFAEYALDGKIEKIDDSDYYYLAFSSSNPISGCNYKDIEIRKGSVSEICRYLNIAISVLPTEILKIKENIAATHGTPLLLTLNKKIIGVVHLRDKLRKHVKKQIEKLHNDGIATIMITGDNSLTAGYIAKKLGMHAYYAEAVPEKKLQFIKNLQQQGYIVAMYGDGVNDALALAQADVGITFEHSSMHAIKAGNVVSLDHDLSAILDLRNTCRRMTIKRGSLTVFSLASDIAKYFVIIPAIFTTAFPALSALNIIHLSSLDHAMLAIVMFNALIILFLTPIVFKRNIGYQSKKLLWINVILYGLGGIISPFVCIKIFDMIITNFSL